MRQAIWPEVAVQPRLTSQERYVRSYVTMRAAIGGLGAALPPALVFLEPVLFEGQPFLRGSLSAYYYSGMRELFVGLLWAIGIFLVIYKLPERSKESRLSTLAGLSAIVVAIFPTKRPGEGVVPTPLQALLGETTVATIHFSAAGVFIACLAVISWFFSAPRPDAADRSRSVPHLICVGFIVAAGILAAVTGVLNEPPRGILVGEWVAVWAFAASWLMKVERDILLGRQRADRQARAVPS